MLGVLVNALSVIIGSVIGCLFKKKFPQKIADAVMFGLGMCTIYIGISGMFDGSNTLILIISIVIGAVIGTALNIDGFIKKAADKVEAKFRKNKNDGVSFAEGMVSGSLLFCIGAMSIVGSLNAGFGDNEMIFTKSMLDFVAAAMLSVSLGIGVSFSAVTVFVFQGLIALCAGFLKPYLTAGLIAEITCTGSLLVAVIGFNMAGITKAKTANYLPALIITPIIYFIFRLLHI